MMPGSAMEIGFESVIQAIAERCFLEGIAYDGTTPRTTETAFALTVGPQWLAQYTGGNAAVIVPAPGSPGDDQAGSGLRALHTQNTAGGKAVFSYWVGFDYHVWGREPDASIQGIQRDTLRMKEARQIVENLLRISYLLTQGSFRLTAIGANNGDTQVFRYGEAILASVQFRCPVYDYPGAVVPVPQKTLTNGQPNIVNPGDA